MMTIDECMAKATAAIDELIDNAMAEGVRWITDRGATDEEVENFCDWYAAQLAADRATKLADVRAWLGRRGSTLQ